MRLGFAAILLMGTIGFTQSQPAGSPPPSYTYRVVHSFPHDRRAFTQGLIYRKGFLYEGTGMNGQSGIRKVALETGEVLQVHAIPRQYFGEGITEWRGSIIQLTWQSEIGFVYDLTTFQQTRTFAYRGEGWGLTHDGARLIMSDGSSALRFLDPATFQESGRLAVRDQNGPVQNLNELEYVRGEIFANVWNTDRIARISLKDGRVTGWIDLSGLLAPADRGGADVLNGIAYDEADSRLFVTGKWWPRLFEIKLVQRKDTEGHGRSRGGY
jgi:glutamine cyclotransferase